MEPWGSKGSPQLLPWGHLGHLPWSLSTTFPPPDLAPLREAGRDPGQIQGGNVGVYLGHPRGILGEASTVSGNARWARQHRPFPGSDRQASAAHSLPVPGGLPLRRKTLKHSKPKEQRNGGPWGWHWDRRTLFGVGRQNHVTVGSHSPSPVPGSLASLSAWTWSSVPGLPRVSLKLWFSELAQPGLSMGGPHTELPQAQSSDRSSCSHPVRLLALRI